METEIEIGRHFLDRLLADHVAGKDVLKETCMIFAGTNEIMKVVLARQMGLRGARWTV